MDDEERERRDVYGRTEIVLEPSDFGVQTCKFPDSVDLFVPMVVV